jgi:maltodextrin utilization protein YvdJ
MRKVLLAFAMLAAPRAALACAVCFGQSDSPMAIGVNMGIFLMLGVTGAVLAGFASFFIYLVRRARLFAEHEQARTVGTEGIA